MHGQTVALKDDVDFFRVVKPDEEDTTKKWSDATLPEPVSTRTGMYSRVGRSQEFEWDGWARR
jgi:hypothetical protein